MELQIGDVIKAAFGVPESSDATDEAIAEQVRPPTPEELAAIEKVAAEASALQDELSKYSDQFSKLRDLKRDLTGRMVKHGMKELKIAGRPAIELADTNSRKPTRKAIVAAMQKAYVEKLGEKEGMKVGKQKAFALWGTIDPTPGHKLTIPEPVPESDEVEPSY